MTPFFSIIIPVYNAEHYLRECLDSVLSQTYTDWEAICVDDGSTDSSGAILDEYAARDPRFRRIHQSNSGVSVARNTALDAVKGEWILFVDSDDMLKPFALDRFVHYEPKADIVYFGMDFVFSDGCIATYVYPDVNCTNIDDNTSYIVTKLAKCAMGVDFFGYTWDKFIRGDLLRRCNVRFEEGIDCWEDALFALKVFSVAKTFAIIGDSLYSYRYSQSGLTYSSKKPMIRTGMLFEKYGNDAPYCGLRRFAVGRAWDCYVRAMLQGRRYGAARQMLRLYRESACLLDNRGGVKRMVELLSKLPIEIGSTMLASIEFVRGI